MNPVFIHDSMTKSEFQKSFSKIEVIDCKSESIKESISRANIVFSNMVSTAFFDAILMGKVCILLTTNSRGDTCNFKMWGVQVVTHFDQIDWEKKADPTKLRKELEPKRWRLDIYQ